MRILLAAKHPPGGVRPFGGVQSWCETLAHAWARLCVETVFWGPEFPLPKGRFDLGIFANISHTAAALGLCRQVINVSHGVIPDERPHSQLKRLFTSEEVRAHWKMAGNIVRQPIDLEYWSPSDEARDALLFYSYRAPGIFGLDELAERIGLEFVHVSEASKSDARDMMRRAALCCASGRAALEAMACGAPTMICDWRPYNGGPLVHDDLDAAKRHNYSGRGGVDPQTVDLEEMARAAISCANPRKYVEKRHDAVTMAKEILSLV